VFGEKAPRGLLRLTHRGDAHGSRARSRRGDSAFAQVLPKIVDSKRVVGSARPVHVDAVGQRLRTHIGQLARCGQQGWCFVTLCARWICARQRRRRKQESD
jgi:hypothetical protein